MGVFSTGRWLSMWTRRDCYAVEFETWWFHLQNRDAVAGGFEGRKIAGSTECCACCWRVRVERVSGAASRAESKRVSVAAREAFDAW